MDFKFIINIDIDGYKTCNLWFKINDKTNEFTLNVKPPVSDDWTEINAYSFYYEFINERGFRKRYTEYVNCFEEIANDLEKKEPIYLFNLNISEEFKDVDKKLLKKYFLEINKQIIYKLRPHFKYYLKEEKDDLRYFNDTCYICLFECNELCGWKCSVCKKCFCYYHTISETDSICKCVYYY